MDVERTSEIMLIPQKVTDESLPDDLAQLEEWLSKAEIDLRLKRPSYKDLTRLYQALGKCMVS